MIFAWKKIFYSNLVKREVFNSITPHIFTSWQWVMQLKIILKKDKQAV